jgi:hypothetical protein
MYIHNFLLRVIIPRSLVHITKQLYLEAGDNIFLRNVGTGLQDYMV